MATEQGFFLDKLPPHDIEAEESVLGSLLIDPEAINAVAPILRVEDFYQARCRHVYEACTALFRAGVAVDQVTVSNALSAAGKLPAVGGLGYLAHLQVMVPTSLHAAHYAAIVRRLAEWRAIVQAASKLLFDAYEGRGEPGDAVSSMVSELARAVSGGEKRGLRPAKDVAGRALTRWHEIIHPEFAMDPPVPTGLKDLDKYLRLMRRMYVILGGRPSMGKTSLANVIAHNIARAGKPVLIVTMEEPDEEVELKEAYRTTGIDESEVRNRGKAWPAEEAAMDDAIDAQARLPIEYIDESGVTTAGLDAYIGLAKAKHPDLFLVVIDHLGHLADPRGRLSTAEWMSGISKAVLALARKHEVCILALSQLNRETENRGGDFRPRLADLRESGALEQDAHAVLLAYRQDYYEERKMITTADPKAKGTLEIIVAKQRSGPVGPVRFAWVSGPQRILDLAKGI